MCSKTNQALLLAVTSGASYYLLFLLWTREDRPTTLHRWDTISYLLVISETTEKITPFPRSENKPTAFYPFLEKKKRKNKKEKTGVTLIVLLWVHAELDATNNCLYRIRLTQISKLPLSSTRSLNLAHICHYFWKKTGPAPPRYRSLKLTCLRP